MVVRDTDVERLLGPPREEREVGPPRDRAFVCVCLQEKCCLRKAEANRRGGRVLQTLSSGIKCYYVVSSGTKWY